MNIHYHTITGEITSWGSGEHVGGSHFPDHDVLHIDDVPIDPQTQKIVGGKLVQKTNEEIQAARRPSATELEVVIRSELAGTDHYFLADRNLPEEVTAPWACYRAALRKLFGLSVDEQLSEWPARPDGVDPLSHLRARL